MQDFKKDFIRFEQIIHPIVKKEVLHKKVTQFGLGFRNIDTGSNDFMMKFKIISPWNQVESIKIVHGYFFRVDDSFVLQQNSEKLANFFAYLVTESLKKVNGSLCMGEIEIPTHQSLFNAIFLVLMSRYN